jgi:hypothetical protein
MEEWDPYEFGMKILDTDYNSYLTLYHCREMMEEEGLKHFIAMSILVRDVDTFSGDKLDEVKSGLQK